MTSHRSTGYLITLLVILSGLLPLAARTFSFDQEKCHIEIPDGWSEQKIEGNQISAVSPNQTKTFILRIGKIGPQLTLNDPSFIKAYEGSMTANGLTITDRQHIPLAGVDAYVVDSNQTVPAGTIFNRMILAVLNGYAYGLNSSKLNAKPSEDIELNGIIKSFAFGTEPVAPRNEDVTAKVETPKNVDVTAKAESPKSAQVVSQTEIPKVEDQGNKIAVDIAMLIGVLAGIFLCIWILCRKQPPS